MHCILTQDQIDKAVAFHGHECPGLWNGLRAAELCLRELGHKTDNTVKALVETDICGVDGIQALTGCTFGKDNLIYKDFGRLFLCSEEEEKGRRGRKENIFNPSLLWQFQVADERFVRIIVFLT